MTKWHHKMCYFWCPTSPPHSNHCISSCIQICTGGSVHIYMILDLSGNDLFYTWDFWNSSMQHGDGWWWLYNEIWNVKWRNGKYENLQEFYVHEFLVRWLPRNTNCLHEFTFS